MKLALKFTGVREMEQRFERIDKSVRRSQQQIAQEAAELVAEEARRLVPVLTGELRDSIIISERQLGGAFKMNMRTLTAVRLYVGPRKGAGYPNGYQGHMIEFGTVKMAAQPFMRPAFDNTRAEVFRLMAAETWKSIVKAVR